jgi:multidrug resistance efflux pump
MAKKKLSAAEKECKRAQKKFQRGHISERKWDEARAAYFAVIAKAKQSKTVKGIL